MQSLHHNQPWNLCQQNWRAETDLSGAASLTNVTVTGATLDGANLTNSNVTLNTFTVTGGNYSSTNNAFATADSGLIVIAKSTGVITAATVSGVTFNANFSSAIQSFAQHTATIGDITVSGCTFTNNGASAADFDAGPGTGQMKFHFLNNLTITGNKGPVINVFSSAVATGGLIQGRIDGNNIGTNAVVDSGSTGGAGIRVFLQGTAGNITIVNNTIRSTACSRGIEVLTLGPVPANGGVRQSDIVITGNNVNNFSSDCLFPLNDIYLASDNQAGGAGTTLRAEVHNNTIKTAGAIPGNTDLPFDNLEWLYFEHTAGTAQLVDVNPGAPHANANAAIAGTQTGGTAKANAAVTLILGPINTVARLSPPTKGPIERFSALAIARQTINPLRVQPNTASTKSFDKLANSFAGKNTALVEQTSSKLGHSSVPTPKASAAEVARLYRSERPLSNHAVRHYFNASAQKQNAPTSGENVTVNTIATFPAGGKSITIKYSATVNTPPLARSVQTQGTVTANAGAISVNTTDPETGTAVPTKTNIDTLMTWNGATSTDWNTATNWTQPAGGSQYAPGVSNPAVNDVVIPNVGAQPNISATDITVFSLNISNGRTLTITSPRVLTIGGSPGGDLTLDGIISGGSLNLGTGTHVINNAGGTGSLSSTNIATVLSGSTVTLNNNLQAGALGVNAGGSMNITNRTLSLNGPFGLVVAGGVTFTTTGSTVIFNGTAVQQAAGIAYNNLTINNTTGLNVTGVTLIGNATVNGALTLTSSDLDTGAFTLTQPNTTASTGVSDVVGTVSRTGGPFAPATVLTFGNPNNQISFTAAGTKPCGQCADREGRPGNLSGGGAAQLHHHAHGRGRLHGDSAVALSR
jgi:hypothetical protein